MMLARMLRHAREAAQRDRSGATAIEFALVSPVFLFAMFMFFDLGLEFFAQSALDAAVQNAARQIQIGINRTAGSGAANVRSLVCSEMGNYLVPNCSILQVYAGTASSFSGLVSTTPDSSGNLLLQSFNPGSARTPVILQVGFHRNIFSFPLSGQTTSPTLVTSLVFMNE